MPSLSVITKISRTIMLSYCFLSRQLHQAFKKGNQLVHHEKKGKLSRVCKQVSNKIKKF